MIFQHEVFLLESACLENLNFVDGQNGSNRSRFRIGILSNVVGGLVDDPHQGYSDLICFPTIQAKNINVLPVWAAPPPGLVSSLA